MMHRSTTVRVMVRLIVRGPASCETLEEELQVQEKCIRASLKTLKKLGFIELRGRDEHGRNKRGLKPYLHGETVLRGTYQP